MRGTLALLVRFEFEFANTIINLLLNSFKSIKGIYETIYKINSLNSHRINLTFAKSFLLLIEFVVFHLSILFYLKQTYL